MNQKQRYQGKAPALLFVPEFGTSKKGWVQRLQNKAKLNNAFRVFTPKADLLHQVNKLPACFKYLIILNDPLNGNYKQLLKAANRKGLMVIGFQTFRNRAKVLGIPDLTQWSKYLKHE